MTRPERRGVPLPDKTRAQLIELAQNGGLDGTTERSERARLEALGSLARSRGVPLRDVLAAVEQDEDAVRSFVRMPPRQGPPQDAA